MAQIEVAPAKSVLAPEVACESVRAEMAPNHSCCVHCHERQKLQRMVLDGRPVLLCCALTTLAVEEGSGRLSFDLDASVT
jgi:hypothetical protein